MTEQLVDRIYEATFVPELWPGVLNDMSRQSGSAAGALLVFDGGARPPRYCTTELTQGVLSQITTTDDWKHSVCVRTLTWVKPGALSRFFYLDDYTTPEQHERDRSRIRLAEHGLGEQLSARIPLPSGETVAFTLERWLRDGRHQPKAVAKLDRLRPHLARAGMVAARLWLERAQAAVETLEAIRLPAAVIGGSGRVLALNGLMEDLHPLVFPTAFGGIAIADKAADALLSRAIETAASDCREIIGSIPIPGTEHRKPAVMHVLPVKGIARDILVSGAVMLVVTMVSDDAPAPSHEILTSLFDLTPAEAGLAGMLMIGRSVAEAAVESGISVKSARTYLDRIFYKTGTHRQSQLLALLRSTRLGKG